MANSGRVNCNNNLVAKEITMLIIQWAAQVSTDKINPSKIRVITSKRVRDQTQLLKLLEEDSKMVEHHPNNFRVTILKNPLEQ